MHTQDQKIKRLVTAALFAALVCMATMLLAFPLPGNGFANLGDCFVILCGALLGPFWGAAAAAVGAALADGLLGYAVYAPATFLIKGLMAVCVHLVWRKGEKGNGFVRTLAAALLGEAVMVGGYFLFEWCLFGIGVAAADCIGNGVQGLIGAAAGTPLLFFMARHPLLHTFFR